VYTQNSDTPSLITRVNVTPIIDVALVLVIILLVTAPLLSVPDTPVQLPEARARAVEEQNLSITLGQNGEIAIDRTPVPAADFVAVLQRELARPENVGVLVLVRADAGTPYTQVGALLDEARAAGAQRLAIATRQAPTAAETVPAAGATQASAATAPPSAGATQASAATASPSAGATRASATAPPSDAAPHSLAASTEAAKPQRAEKP